MSMPPALLAAADEAGAQEALAQLGCTDGLPVVVPTPERVEAMLAGTGRPPTGVLGNVAPRMGVATVHSVAVNAVMAGCEPGDFEVVCAAVRAVCDPGFELGVVQGTTNNVAPLVVVNGGPPTIACGTGALGPGHRGNATVGRALRLVLLNAGGGHPGTVDMATLGQPAKFTYVVAENVGESPFPPLSPEPAVTVVAVEGPSQVMFVPVGDSVAADAARLLELLVRTLLLPGSLGAMGYGGSAAIVLSPLHAEVLAAGSYTRELLQATIHARAVLPAAEVVRLHGFVRGSPEVTGDQPVHVLTSPDHLVIAVAGGAGTYSVAMAGMAEGVGPPIRAPLAR